MRSPNARPSAVGLALCAVAVCAATFAIGSAPWVSPAFAGPVEPEQPARPMIAKGLATTPVKLELVWGANVSTPTPAPEYYAVTIGAVTQPSITTTSWVVSPCIPGASYPCTVVAYASGRPSEPATLTIKLPRAPVALGKPSVPRTGRTSSSLRVSGKVVSTYNAGRAAAVKLKFYRHQKTKSGKWYWDLKKTVRASRPSSTTYSAYVRLSPADTWSVVAQTYANDTHLGDRSSRSRHISIK